QTGLDQLDPPTVRDLVVGRCRHRHGPAEVVRDPEAHVDSVPSTTPRRPARGQRSTRPPVEVPDRMDRRPPPWRASAESTVDGGLGGRGVLDEATLGRVDQLEEARVSRYGV